MIYPVILCGGSGTRLWPKSNDDIPKQFLSLFSKNSLLQETVLRFTDKTFYSPLFISNVRYENLIRQQLQEIGITNYEIILEPISKNTAPAIAAAAYCMRKKNQNAYMLVLPADHRITDVKKCKTAIQKAYEIAKEYNRFVLFGISPSYPETGYGYIQPGAHIKDYVFEIENFKEKPDVSTAENYIKYGYLWNSGMFLLPVELFLKEMHEYAGKILQYASKAVEKAEIQNNVIKLNEANFKKSPEEPIDTTLMEKTYKSAVIKAKFPWSDIGSWQALYAINEKDNNNNVLKGRCVLINTVNSYIESNSRIVAVAGLDNMAVIETKDAVLIVPLDKTQKVKNLVEKIKGSVLNEEKIRI